MEWERTTIKVRTKKEYIVSLINGRSDIKPQRGLRVVSWLMHTQQRVDERNQPCWFALFNRHIESYASDAVKTNFIDTLTLSSCIKSKGNNGIFAFICYTWYSVSVANYIVYTSYSIRCLWGYCWIKINHKRIWDFMQSEIKSFLHIKVNIPARVFLQIC